MPVPTLLIALAFAAVHIWIGRLHMMSGVPRSVWLSLAGGVAVSYVFLHILPDLAAHRQTFSDGLAVSGSTAETMVFSVALAGLTVFYGLERLVVSQRAAAGGGDSPGDRVFWIHLGSFAAYNALIGYLTVSRAEIGLSELVLYGVAMGTHFLTTDFGLRSHHSHRYDDLGRWILAVAVLAGWGLAQMAELSPLVVGFLFAFLAGSAMLNILKEELPENRQSRFWAFLAGAGVYAGLLALL